MREPDPLIGPSDGIAERQALQLDTALASENFLRDGVDPPLEIDQVHPLFHVVSSIDFAGSVTDKAAAGPLSTSSQ